MAQRLEPEVEETLPTLYGVKYYLAVPDIGQPWQMAIFDDKTGKWRAIDVPELQALAQQMGQR